MRRGLSGSINPPKGEMKDYQSSLFVTLMRVIGVAENNGSFIFEFFIKCLFL